MSGARKAPAKGGRRAKAPATRSGSETRQREQTVITSPPGYTADLDARAAVAGMTRSAYVRAAVEAYGGPAASTITVSVDAAMLAALSDCDGVPPGVRARVLLREVLGLWGAPVGEKAAESRVVDGCGMCGAKAYDRAIGDDDVMRNSCCGCH